MATASIKKDKQKQSKISWRKLMAHIAEWDIHEYCKFLFSSGVVMTQER